MNTAGEDWSARLRPGEPLYALLRSPLRLYLLSLFSDGRTEALDAARLSYKSGVLVKDVLAAIAPLVEQDILEERVQDASKTYRLHSDHGEPLRVALRGFLHEHRHLVSRYLFVREEVFGGLIGADDRMKVVHQLIHLAARLGTPMLIGGEAGTGKLQAARAVHALSGHEPDELRELSAPDALHRDLADLAASGTKTLVLRHLESLSSPRDQERLFRNLSPLSVGTPRLIATMRRDLAPLGTSEFFHAGLLGLFNVFPLRLPSLRERRTDLPLLIADVLQQECQTLFNDPFAKSLSEEARGLLLAAPWTGNIAQLRQVLRQAAQATHEPMIGKASIQGISETPQVFVPSQEPDSLSWSLDDLEADHLRRLLPALSNNISEAARRLGITRATLYKKLRHHGLALPRSGKTDGE